MKKKVKQIFAALLVAVMLVGVMPVISFAEDGEKTFGYLKYTVTDGEVTITNCDTSISGELTIPEAIEGYPVKRINRWAFDGCVALTSIMISNNVTSIDTYAFNNCIGLTKIKVSEDNKIYDSRDNCNAIIETAINQLIVGCKNTAIPNDVISIGMGAFLGCTGLKSITIPDSVTSIDACAFLGCTSLKSITIPDSVTSIDSSVFKNCSGLTSITIPDSVTSIDSSAFENCSGLTSITIPDSVTSIDTFAFENCSGLTNITIPDNVTSIGYQAFYNTAYYNDKLNWKNGVLYIGNHLIEAKDDINGTYAIKNGTICIGDSAFEDCNYLTSVTIPNSVTSIPEFAFSYCTELISVTVGNGVTSIGRYAFCGCTILTNVTIPEGITKINAYTFEGCTSLSSVAIPNSVLEIGYRSFSDCTSLTNVIIPDSVTNINSYAFDGCTGLTSITIPNSVTEIGDGSFSNCTGIKELTIPCLTDLFEFDYQSSPFYGCNNIEIITITKKEERIPSCPYETNNVSPWHYSEENIKKIIIEQGITSIGDYAFSGLSNLTSVTIPDSVTSIGNRTFAGCTGLTIIMIPNSITSIGNEAFFVCTGLASITIPDRVTSIGQQVFNGCTGLTSVTIPDSVTTIESYAFYNCNSLTDVYYSGSKQSWNNIVIDDGNDYLKNATIHFNSTGHVHTLDHITVPSTCKVAGMEYDICSECGETFNEKTLPLAAHTWGEWTVVKEATTTAEGQEKRTCSVCDKVETRAIEKLKVIKDDKTGLEINYNDEYDSDTEIKVEEQFSGKSFQLINTEFGKVNSKIYDIATYKDGVKVQPNGEITVKVPLPDGFTTNKVFVCYVDSVSGKVTKIPCEVKDGYVIFKTNHFSEYAIVEQSANVKSVSVSDITLNYKKSATIKPTIKADEGAKYTVKYSSSNTKVATVDENGKVYAAKKGSATITCTVTDSNGNTVQDTCKVTVKYSFGQWLIKILLFGWIWY